MMHAFLRFSFIFAETLIVLKEKREKYYTRTAGFCITKNMNQPLKIQKFFDFIGLNEEDISDRYFSLLIAVLTVFLFTQVVYVAFWSPIL